MVIFKNKVVTLIYELRNGSESGVLIEKTSLEQPLVFLFGVGGGTLPDFEANLLGLEKGSNFAFEIKSERAYGEIDENAIIGLPIQTFVFDGKLATDMLVVGKAIPMRNDQNQLIHGKIIEVKEEEVMMDFNHPLAGIDLYFSGEVLDIRQATESEIAHGHAHGPGGHEH